MCVCVYPLGKNRLWGWNLQHCPTRWLRYRFFKKHSSRHIFVIFKGGQVLIQFSVDRVFLQVNGPGHLFFIEQRYWSMHIVPCWNILLQVRPQQEPKRPSCSEDFKISPQNSQSDDIPYHSIQMDLSDRSVVLRYAVENYYLSALWTSCVSRLQRILHSSSSCNSTVGVNVIPSTLGRPLRQKPANSTETGRRN